MCPSPNDLIDMETHAAPVYFRWDHAVEQVHYLRQFGVQIE
jgi:hypothetical protein